MMKAEKYFINLDGVESEELIEEWRWVVPSDMKLVAVTKFGDLFFKTDDDRVVFLDTLDGLLSDQGLYSENIFDEEKFRQTHLQLLSTDWVEVCGERGMSLGIAECFGWRVHPIVGGKFVFDNIGVFSLRVYESMVGQLLRQIQGKPQGFQISGFTLIDPKPSKIWKDS